VILTSRHRSGRVPAARDGLSSTGKRRDEFATNVRHQSRGGMNVRRKITQVILTTAAVITFTFAAPNAFAGSYTQQDKPTAGREMKESGKEGGRAGKSLGHNFKHGRFARGGKHFGQHVGRGGKHVGRGTKRAFKNAVNPR